MSEDNFDEQFEDEDFEEEETAEFEEGFEEETETEETTEETTETSEESEEGYEKPVSEGDHVEVDIEDLGSKGDGIARVEGFVIFVPGGEVGETYEVEVTSVGRKFAFAEIAE